jgi:hypothetical protein
VEYDPVGNDAATDADAGGTYGTAVALAGKGEIQGYTTTAGDVDYYTFSATSGNRYEVVLTPPPGKNYDVDIRNASDVSKATGTSSGDTEEIVKFTADSTGTWAVKVSSAGTDYDAVNPYTLSIYDANYYYVRQDGSGGQKNGDPTNSAQCFSNINGALATLKTDYSNKISNQGKVFITVRDITAGTYPACTLDGLATDFDGILVLENYSAEAPVIYGATAHAIGVGNAAQTDGNVANLIVKGLTIKSSAASYSALNLIHTNLLLGRQVFKSNVFDGQGSGNEAGVAQVNTTAPRIDVTFSLNEFKNYYDDTESAPMFLVSPSATSMLPTITLADNSIHDNRTGTILYCFSAAANYNSWFIDRNNIYNNRSSSNSSGIMGIIHAYASNSPTQTVTMIRNNFIYNNDWSYVATHYTICDPGGTIGSHVENIKIYNNTFYLNKVTSEIYMDAYAQYGVEVTNNIIAPSPGSSRYAIYLVAGSETYFTSANNAFYVDFAGDGYPSGSTFDTADTNETVGYFGAGGAKNTSTWNAYTSNNTGNGYTLGGPGVTSASDMHLTGTSLCHDLGVTLADNYYDFDRETRPIGAAYDIGGDESAVAVAGSWGTNLRSGKIRSGKIR